MDKLEKKRIMKGYYDDLYGDGSAFREKWEGKIGINYKVPKEVGYLVDLAKGIRGVSILEVGAGDGYSSKLAISKIKPTRYIATELSREGVERIRRKGIESEAMDATDLKFKDNSFDVVCCFNVMHHVDNPRKMGQEMLRVAKRYVLLCEANGLSIPRKILELTPRNRKANENSYLPWQYKAFFQGKSLEWIRVKPFNFAFAFTPGFLYRPAVWLSELCERIPLFRWQGSSLLIVGKKKDLHNR